MRDCTDQGDHKLFLDLRALDCVETTAGDDIRAVFALGPGVRFHLISAPARFQACVTGDDSFVLHTSLATLRRRGACPEGPGGPRALGPMGPVGDLWPLTLIRARQKDRSWNHFRNVPH